MTVRFFCFLIIGILLLSIPASADTLIVYTTNTTDGHLMRSVGNETWTQQRDGVGNAIDITSAYVLATIQTQTTYVDKYSFFRRGALIFDTSGIPDDVVSIDSAIISLYRAYTASAIGDEGVGITNFTIEGTLDAEDYNNYDYTLISNYNDISTMGTNKYYNWTLNAGGLGAISKTGSTGFGVLLEQDITNTPMAWISNVKNQFQFNSKELMANPPYLTITYTPAAGGVAPVSSFTLQKPLLRIPMTLQVNDTSTNTPTLWNWSWGDGTWTNGTTQNATHKYTTRGLKSILLVTSNAVGANTTPTASTVRIVGYENYW